MITPQYLAGLIDGEGYLGLLPVRNKETINPCFEPVIKIGMTGTSAYELMNAIKERYTGNVQLAGRRSKGAREVYTIVIKSKKLVKALLLDIYPYLMVKKDQAQVLLDFCDLPFMHPLHVGYDVKIVQKREKYYWELKRLKQPEPLAETK
jgi:hypothetical protein